MNPPSPPVARARSSPIPPPFDSVRFLGGRMASPPPFDIWDDLDDDIDEPATAVPADRHHPAAAPTPNGLNDCLLRLARSRQDPNPNPIPPAEAAAAGEARKVKLSGRRRLCKLAATSTQQLEEEEDHDDGESIHDIMDDLTTRPDSLSVHKPKPNPTARPTEQQLVPLPCAITEADPPDDQNAEDGKAHAGASSPLRISSSNDDGLRSSLKLLQSPQPLLIMPLERSVARGRANVPRMWGG